MDIVIISRGDAFMEELLDLLSRLMESIVDNDVKVNFNYQNVNTKKLFYGLAYFVYNQQNCLELYREESYIKIYVGAIIHALKTKERSYISEQQMKEFDTIIEASYRQVKYREYNEKYSRSSLDYIYYLVIEKYFSFHILEGILEFINDSVDVRKCLSVINMNSIDAKELENALNDMVDYYSSQCAGYKPIKECFNKAWRAVNLGIAESGITGAVLGTVVGGPIGAIAGSAIACWWADREKHMQ